jgi:hypothetical protein
MLRRSLMALPLLYDVQMYVVYSDALRAFCDIL